MIIYSWQVMSEDLSLRLSDFKATVDHFSALSPSLSLSSFFFFFSRNAWLGKAHDYPPWHHSCRLDLLLFSKVLIIILSNLLNTAIYIIYPTHTNSGGKNALGLLLNEGIMSHIYLASYDVIGLHLSLFSHFIFKINSFSQTFIFISFAIFITNFLLLVGSNLN